MKSTNWLKLSVAMLALLAIGLFAVACSGGDDDDDSGGNSSTASADNNETPTKAASNNSSDANPTNADEKYVAQVCKATLNFLNAIKAVKPEDLQDESKATDILKKPFQDYVNAMDDADPPKDAKSYHEEALKQLKATLKALQDGDANAFEQLSSNELPDPPGDLAARLEAAASKNKDCQDTGFTFGQ